MKVVYTVIILFLLSNMYGTIRIVKRNGTGQYYTIQSAITASVHGDTILVYPATYYENINYNGKNITIASLELTTGNPAYRDSTIIDGNYGGSCVRFISHEDNAALYGFTIQHGSGTPYEMYGATIRNGGGIWIMRATNIRITNCLIKDCRAYDGGGIAMLNGTVSVKGLIIRDNYASQGGGGINVGGVSNIFFDSTDRCSVYENYAGNVNDVFCGDTNSIVDVYIDMATVYPITSYYIRYSKSTPTWFGNFGIVDIQRGYRSEVNHDLYLSPNGNDANDGFSPATPKKTIAKALHTIASDSLNAKTIYLAPGTYSSENGQLFPLSMKKFVNVIGDSISPPILINQRYETTFKVLYSPNVCISNLILEHGNHSPLDVFGASRSNNMEISNLIINPVNAIKSAGISIYQSKFELDNIRLNGLTSIDNSGLVVQQSDGSITNLYINDCHNTGNEDQTVFSIVYIIDFDSLLIMDNVTVTNCSVVSSGVGILGVGDSYGDNPMLYMSNVLIANNNTNGNSPILLDHLHDNSVNISNCSFVNNTGTTITAKISGNFIISNCIFDNNNATEISIRELQACISQIDFNNNLIEGYPNSVYVHESNEVTFNEFNFSADPGFIGTDWTNPLSYRLSQNSPCIDAGTPDTTGLFLPLTDLYGNPRIYNGIIDIGCYEWNGVPNQDDNMPVPDTNTLSIYPNPFINSTSICYNLDKASNVILEVYNTKGQRVKRPINSKQAKGAQVINWDGRDENGIKCSSGLYLIKYSIDGKKPITKKISLIK